MNNDEILAPILMEALEEACKFIRKNPPADLGMYPTDMLPVLVGGMERDPEGKEYFGYFVRKVCMKNKKEDKDGDK